MAPTRSETIDNLFTTTWRNVKSKVIDQAFAITPFFNIMLANGRIRETEVGGRYIDIPVAYDKADQNIAWLDRGDELGVAEGEFLTQLSFKMKYLGDSIVRYWVDDQQNRGKAKLQDYVNEKISNHKSSLIDTLEVASFNADPSGKGITPLTTLVAESPATGIVGGLDRATYTWLRNKSTAFSGTIASDLIPTMRTMVNDLSKFKSGMRRSPDIIITTQSIYEEFEEIAEAMQQIVTSQTAAASLGFGDLSYKNIPIFWCPECPAGNMYFLNTEHLKFVIDSYAYFDMGPWKEKIRSRDRVTQILTCCELICDNFQKQGVIHGIA